MDPQTNWSGILTSLIRFAFGTAVGMLVSKGVVTHDQGEFILASVAAGAVTIATAIWIWFKTKAAAKLEQAQIKVALQATPDTPVAAVKYEAQQVIKQGDTR